MCDPVTLRVSGAVSVATGDGHSCAALDDGQVVCWGANAAGQLGDGGLEESTIPVTVANLAGAVAVAAGAQHTCALLITGEVRCWGDNSAGQLGTGTTGGVRVIPFPVCSEPSGVECTPMRGAVAITAGSDTTCVLLADGTLRCWGSNTFRQLGIGRQLNGSVDRPQPVCAPDPDYDCGDPDYDCRGYLSNVVAVDLGYNSACALIAGGTVRCWGQNASLQLGNGDPGGISRCVPTRVCEREVGLCGAGDQASGYAVQTCDVATVVVAP
jgi:alpha-tubulin suppressor-like RCC1 family protein